MPVIPLPLSWGEHSDPPPRALLGHSAHAHTHASVGSIGIRVPRLRGGAPRKRNALDLEEQLVEERPRRWMEEEMWEKTEGNNERWQCWRYEKMKGLEEGGIKMTIGLVMVNMVEVIKYK